MSSPTVDIPHLTTEELWKQYVIDNEVHSTIPQATADEFFVTRLEDFRNVLRLPTQPHRRDVNELVFVTNGQLVRGCNLSKIELGPGSVHLLLSNQIATLDSLSPDVTGFYCHFSLDTIIRLYHREHMVHELSVLNAAMTNKAVLLPSKAFMAVKTVFERLIDEYKTNNDLSLIDAYLVTLCYEIKNALPAPSPKPKPGKAYELTEQFKQLITQHVSNRPPMAFYADQLGVSPNHLNKAVRQVTGQPASALVNDVLLLEAKVLLKHTNQPISEIAFRLGFSDQSYFSRFFRKSTGLPPQAFRQND